MRSLSCIVNTYKKYLLSVLMVILAFNYVDRLALGIVLQDIKADLQLTDTELGLLAGIAFTLFYAVMGIPISRWSDRGNRVTIITLTTAVWSAAVALCGTAASFIQLMLIRVGVAIGEAGCVPPAHSLIADYFPREERSRAVARYMLGTPLGLTIGYFSAGWLNELYGWRTTFAILGLPGLALAALVWLTLKEPRVQPQIADQPQKSAFPAASGGPGFKEVCRSLWANVAFRHLLICHSVWYFFCFGILQWQPAFFVRSHGMETGEVGMWFALIYGVGGGAGVYLGGELASRYASRNERLQLNACAVAFAFYAVLYIFAFLSTSHYWAIAALAVANLGGSMALGPILATIQTLVPPSMRATSIALVYFFANLIGMGLGPLAAGALSDALQPMFGVESLRNALVILCPGYFWASWHLWRAGQTVETSIEAPVPAPRAPSHPAV